MLPPDPNADPAAIATLQGTGGSACSAGAVYSNIVAGGVTWGTGQAPAPTKDAAGFWHFKPSCYGYLTLGSVVGGITTKQISAESAVQTHFITASLPVASTAGTLLVATINSLTTPNKFAGPAGWTSAAEIDNPGEGRSEIWYYANNPGGISSATFTMNPATVSGAAQISEWNGAATVAPLDQSGTTSISVPVASANTSTVGAMAQSGELAITNVGFKIAVGNTYAQGAGWNSIAKDNTFGFASEYRLDLPVGTAGETSTTTIASNWANVIATFKPASSATGAVLDPGFYYFNGSGFAGGGGICLNGGTRRVRQPGGLLDRDMRRGRGRRLLDGILRFRQQPRWEPDRHLVQLVRRAVLAGPKRQPARRQLPGWLELVSGRRSVLLEPPAVPGRLRHRPDRRHWHGRQPVAARLGGLVGRVHRNCQRHLDDRRVPGLRHPFDLGRSGRRHGRGRRLRSQHRHGRSDIGGVNPGH